MTKRKTTISNNITNLIFNIVVNLASFYLMEKPLFLIWKIKNKRKKFELSCYYPFCYLGLLRDGSSYLCCASWLPYTVGDSKSKPIIKIFNSIQAQRMRIAFYKGDLRFCKTTLCDIVNSKHYKPYTAEYIRSSNLFTEKTKREILGRKLKITNGPSWITDAISTKCNIQCKFCYTRYSENNKCDKDLIDKMKVYIENNAGQLRLLNFCAGGEPFIQQHVKDVMRTVKNNAKIGFDFTSNLNYIDDETKLLLKEINVVQLHASINAAKKETYEKIVKNGNWDHVMQNLDFFINLKEKFHKNMVIRISIVVTAMNYMDIKEFVNLGIGKNLTKIIIYPMIEYASVKYLQITKHELPHIEKMLSDKCFDDNRVEVEPFRDFIKHFKVL